jgi:translation initiation factor 2 subunit 2
MDYEKLLQRGLKKVPEKLKEKSRFVIPKVDATKSGARTNINNIQEVADGLRRDVKHLVKFLLKELATKGEMEGKKLVVLGNFHPDAINRKIELYVKNYVICEECGKPDTKLVKEKGFVFLVCEACGARHPVS